MQLAEKLDGKGLNVLKAYHLRTLTGRLAVMTEVFHVFPLSLHVVIDVVHQSKLQPCISETIPTHYSSSRFIQWYILSAFGMALFNNLRINSYLYFVAL